jgi:DNA mismatch repair protein MLH1
MKFIKIADNGKGIMLEDFPLLCARFATSKIKDFSDMQELSSFGFRG